MFDSQNIYDLSDDFIFSYYLINSRNESTYSNYSILNKCSMNKITDSSFSRLIGVWETSGIIKSSEGDVKITGIDSYEPVLENNYILHKADVRLGNNRSETMEFIKLDNLSNKAIMNYFNSNGEDGIMYGTIINDVFKIEGNGLRFEGNIGDGNTIIIGKWHIQADNENWVDYIDLTLKKRQL